MPLKGLKGSYTYSFGCITSFAIDRVGSARRLLHGERSGIGYFWTFAAFGPRYQEVIDDRFKFFIKGGSGREVSIQTSHFKLLYNFH